MFFKYSVIEFVVKNHIVCLFGQTFSSNEGVGERGRRDLELSAECTVPTIKTINMFPTTKRVSMATKTK